MADARKSAEAARRIQEISRTITTHESNISRFERDKADKVKYYDQLIRREQDEIRRHTKLIDDLKRQI
jgi:hypothetical protein